MAATLPSASPPVCSALNLANSAVMPACARRKVVWYCLQLNLFHLGVEGRLHVPDLLLELMSDRRYEVQLLAVLGAEAFEVEEALLEVIARALQVAHFALDDLTAILQRGHVVPLLARRVHETSDALLHVAHERVVLGQEVLSGEANHTHLRLQMPYLLNQLLVVVMLGVVDGWHLHRIHSRAFPCRRVLRTSLGAGSLWRHVATSLLLPSTRSIRLGHGGTKRGGLPR